MDCANKGPKFWLSIMNNLRNRGVEDILIAVVDGLKGFPGAINAAFPNTDCTNLHRVPCASLPELLRLERPQGSGQRPASGLLGGGRRGSRQSLE